MKVVIADDSPLWRDRIRELLNNCDNISEIYEAENGMGALQIIKIKEPDLAILDIRMPGMNGIEVLKKIRGLKLKVIVCMLTNFPYPQYKKNCLEAGADYFLNKTEEFYDINNVISGLTNYKEKG